MVGKSKTECEFRDALGFSSGNDLEGFHDTTDGLMFQARVLALGIFTNNAKIHVIMTGSIAGNVFDQDDRGIDVELLSESNVEGLVT